MSIFHFLCEGVGAGQDHRGNGWFWRADVLDQLEGGVAFEKWSLGHLAWSSLDHMITWSSYFQGSDEHDLVSSKEANIKCPQTVKNLENKNIYKSVFNQGDQVLRGPVDLAEHRRGGGREERLAEPEKCAWRYYSPSCDKHFNLDLRLF